ncbi:MAG: hypothetical protein Q4D58_01615 [Synergistaceae bacterium]|nr:hypothetical protein [Synergistaceae bacterium]
MKKQKLNVELLILCLFVFAVIAVSGGCSGGSSGGGETKASTRLSFDTDGDGMADVYDACPEDPARTTIDQVNLTPLADGEAASASALLSAESPMPGTVRGVIRGAASASSGSDAAEALAAEAGAGMRVRYRATLKAGLLYSGAFYDIKGGRALNFIPDVTVFGPDGEEIETELSISTEENLGIITYTMTAPADGDYIIQVANADFTDTKTYAFAAAVYEEKGDPGNYGHLVRFRDSAGGSFIYTMRDIVYLRSVLADPHNAAQYDEYGRPIAFCSDIADKWAAALSLVNSAHYRDAGYIDPTGDETAAANASNGASALAAARKARLDPYITGISWNSDNHAFGYGFTAPSGLPADRIRAIKTFTLPDGSGMARETIETTKFISTKEEHEQEMDVSVEASYGTADAGIEASGSYAQSTKYSATNTTLALRYEYRETGYRMLDIDEYELTDAAQKYLDNNGGEAFRERFGDYFVAGARYGAKCVAYVSIKTTSSEQTSAIKAAVSGHGFGAAASADFSEKFKDVSEGCEYTVQYHEYGNSPADSGSGSASVKTMYLTASGAWSDNADDAAVVSAGSSDNLIDEVLAKMNDYINRSKQSDFQPVELEAYMLGFAQINGGEEALTRINVDPKVFVAVRTMTREFLGLTSYANVIADIPANDLRNGEQLKDQFAAKYNAIKDELLADLDYICSDIDEVTAYTDRITALAGEMRVFKERYDFFKTMEKMLANWTNIDKDSERGFWRYSLSTAVDADICRSAYISEETNQEGEIFEITEWWTRLYDTGSDGRIWCWISISDDGGYDYHSDQINPRSFGSRQLKYYVKGWYDKDLRAKIQGAYIDLGGDNRDNYPFNW